MSLYYAGIGSRKTPLYAITMLTYVAKCLANRGWILRSGGANGADKAFEVGCDEADGMADIYLPWPLFNGHASDLHSISTQAMAMAEKYHPAWGRCSPAARKFHARNCYQILGQTLVAPVEFVVCWTPNGEITGGTGQALRIALDHNIPIFNFGSCENQQAAQGMVNDILAYAWERQEQTDTNNENYRSI